MNDERNDLLKSLHYFNIQKYVSITIIFIVILLIGLNILRIYKGYIISNRPETVKGYETENISYNSGTLTLSIDETQTYPMLEIIINGELVNKFGENKQITVNVSERNVVQINGSMYNNDIMVNIKESSSNIDNYLNNKQVLIKQNISTVAVIKM